MGKFWIDLLSTIPTELIIYLDDANNSGGDLSPYTFITMLSLLKLYRISRLNHLIKFSKSKGEVKMAIRIV
jgi:hypothetical protein